MCSEQRPRRGDGNEEPPSPAVLVTGSTGFVGRAVVRELELAGWTVIELARTATATHGARKAVPGDVRDPAALDVAFAHRPRAVVHLVGLSIHVEATEAVLAAAVRHGVRRIVHVSALGAGPHPGRAYHRRKWLAEERVRAAGLDHTILQPSVIFGKDCDFLTSLQAVVRVAGVTPVVGSGRMRLQPLYVGDMAAVVRRCLERTATIGRAYELGGPEVVPLNRIITQLEERAGRRKPRLHLPLWLGRLAASQAARPLQRLFLGTLAERIHPERWLNASQVELLEEDNVCAAPVSPELSDLCGTVFSRWLLGSGAGR